MGRGPLGGRSREAVHRHGVPVATIYDAVDILADPHMGRAIWSRLDDPIAGPLPPASALPAVRRASTGDAGARPHSRPSTYREDVG